MFYKIIKSIFSSLGYEIKNKKYKDIFTIRHSMDEAFMQLKGIGFYPDLVIDVGAADGTPELQNNFKDAAFFWIEPLAEFEKDLLLLTKQLKGEYLIGALGREPGEMEINISNDKVGSSLLDAHNQDIAGSKVRKIKVDSLENLAREKKFNQYKKILLKADVQGYELQVLEGAGSFLDNVEVIVLEVSLYNFLKDCPDFYDIVAYMKRRGFVVYDIVGGINRPLDMALGQKDLVFVKENGFIRKSNSWD